MNKSDYYNRHIKKKNHKSILEDPIYNKFEP